MLTRVGLTFVNVEFAPLPAVALGAVANELAHAVFAASTVEARVRLALVDVAQAPGIKVAARAVAFESIHQIGTFA